MNQEKENLKPVPKRRLSQTEQEMVKSSAKKKQSFYEADQIYKGLFIFYVILICLMIRNILNIDSYFIKEGHGATDFTELLLIIPGTILTWGMFQIVKVLTKDFIIKNQVEHTRVSETPEDRLHRIQSSFNNIIYYSVSVSLNYYLIKTYETRYLPWMMGGELNLFKYLQDWPEIPAWPVRYLFIISIGHHVERTIDHLIYGRKSHSFWLLIFHHVITINLMVCCFCSRQFLFGVPVLFLHDIADIFVGILKVVREIKPWKFLTIPFYINLILTWFVTRMIIFNWELVRPMLLDTLPYSEGEFAINQRFAVLGLFFLVIMNTYWLYGMLEAGYRKIVKNAGEAFALEGEVVDIETEKKEN